MNHLNLKFVTASFICICIIVLTGCFSSTRIYKKEYEKNDSTFVQREVGAEVLIRMNDGEEYTNELLIVNDSTMILCNESGLTEEELFSSVNQINIIRNQDIKSIWILGEDNHLIGLAIGIAVSIPLIIGAQPEEGEYVGDLEMGGLGLMSIVTGFLVGAATSTYDEELYNSKNQEDFDFTQLNIYSRYGDIEPDYLKEIK
jgi:hypothetical protein